MPIPIRLPNKLVRAAREEGKRRKLSVRQQLEDWIDLGRRLDEIVSQALERKKQKAK